MTTTTEQETQSEAKSTTVEWGAEHADPTRVILSVNGASPLTWSTGTGEGSRELRMKLGYNSVPGATLDRLTGGFNSKGEPRRDAMKLYFTRKVDVVMFTASGKAITRKMPLIHVVAHPEPGAEVHMIPARKGSRSHYQSKKRIREQATTAALVEQVQVQGAALAELMKMNQRLMAKFLGDEVPAAPPVRTEPPFDPSSMSVSDLTIMLEGLSEGELELVMGAELRGKQRSTAFDAIKQAFSAQSETEATSTEADSVETKEPTDSQVDVAEG